MCGDHDSDPGLNPESCRPSTLKKNRTKVDVGKKAMERNGNECVFVGFWEADRSACWRTGGVLWEELK